MDKNNDFDSNNHSNDIDEYVTQEILNYYGKDIVNSASKASSIPPPKKKKRRTRIFHSFMSVLCAIIFLTGVIIFSGVFFSSGIPTLNENNTPDTAGSDVITQSANLSSSVSENNSDWDNSIGTNSKSTDTLNSEVTSNQSASMTASQDNSSTQVNSENNSNMSDNSNISNSQSNSVSDNCVSTHSKANSENSQTNESNSVIINDATTSNNASKNVQTVDIPGRNESYSLPEIPDEGTVASVHTDVDNNNNTNPYDNVTTGKKVRAGVGIFLMIMSLAVSLVLNKLKTEIE